MRKALLIITLIATVKRSGAQAPGWLPCEKGELVSAYKKICTWITATESYGFKLRYTSYNDHAGGQMNESSAGYYKRYKNNFKSYAAGIFSMQNEKMRITVDSTDKALIITSPGTLNVATMDAQDLVKLLANVKKISKMPATTSTTYRIDFNTNQALDAYEFQISQNGLLSRLVYYYAGQVEKEYPRTSEAAPTVRTVKPRLVIDFTDYDLSPAFGTGYFSETPFVTAEGTNMKPAGRYKTFRIKDYRLTAKK